MFGPIDFSDLGAVRCSRLRLPAAMRRRHPVSQADRPQVLRGLKESNANIAIRGLGTYVDACINTRTIRTISTIQCRAANAAGGVHFVASG